MAETSQKQNILTFSWIIPSFGVCIKMKSWYENSHFTKISIFYYWLQYSRGLDNKPKYSFHFKADLWLIDEVTSTCMNKESPANIENRSGLHETNDTREKYS